VINTLEKEIPEEIKRLARHFRYFVSGDRRSYNVIDRIANATTPEIAIEALKDGLRALKSEYDRFKEKVKYLPSESDVEKVIKRFLEDIYYAKIFASLVFVWTPEEKEKGGE